MTTLHEIADAAGVHVMTASKALNGGHGNTRVAPATVERIREIATRMGYVRNVNAARLRQPVSRLVGFAGGDVRNPFFAEWQMMLEHALAAHGLELITAQTHGTGVDSIQGAMRNLRQQGLRALCYWSEQGRVEIGSGDGPPAFHIGTRRVSSGGIWFDLAAGLQLLVAHLLEDGARKLGFFVPGANVLGSGETPARLRSFKTICAASGLPEPHVTTYAGESWDLCAAAEATRGLPWSKVDGWIGFNDVASLALLMRRPPSRACTVRVAAVDGIAPIRAWAPTVPHLNLCHQAHAVALALSIANDDRKPLRIKPQLNLST